MPSKDFGEDAAFFLYLVPVVASIVYGAYEWAVVARTSTMPPTAYLIVAKSPYLFMVSLIAILAAIILEVRSANLTERNAIIQANTLRLQVLAVVVLIISFAAAISTADYNLANAFAYFLNGRYPIIFAFFCIGISFLLTPRQIMGNAKLASLPEIAGLILLVLSPVVFYGALKIHFSFPVAFVASLIIGIIGLVLLFGGSNWIGKKPQQAKPAETPQITAA